MDRVSELLAQRVIELTGAITDESAEIVIAKMLFLEDQDATKPIRLRLRTVGGQVSSALAILDTIDSLRCPVHTQAMGGVSGIAVNILAHGKRGERVAIPFAKISFTPIVSSDHADPADVGKTIAVVIDFLVKDTGKQPSDIDADLRSGRELDPEQARSYGIVDRVERIDNAQ